MRLQPVMLSASSADEDAPKWIQVAREGEFRGYHSGGFTFDRAFFEALIRNFRNHPSYTAGADGVGVADVVPYDFHHASEMEPTRGDIALVGAPAQAWVLDLEVRDGDAGAQLWALTRYLEPARTYVKEGKYKWTSVAVMMDSTDPVSGENVGPVLTSIAFTNQPFIQGMHPIAASMGGLIPVHAEDTIEGVMYAMKSCLGLGDMNGLGDIFAQLAKLRAYLESKCEVPAGVDAKSVLSSLRRILNLPTLASVEEIFGEADKLLSRLAAEESATEPQQEMDEMNDMMSILASRLGLSNSEAQGDLKDKVFSALDELTESQKALQTLLSALAADSETSAVSRIASLLKCEKELEEAKPQLEELQAAKVRAEEEAVSKDVERVMSTNQWPASARVALTYLRKSNPEEFKKSYPVSEDIKPEAKYAHLTKTFVKPAEQNATSGSPRQKAVVTLSQIQQLEGRNIVEKAMSFVRAQPGGDKLTYDEVHEQASTLLGSACG